MSAVLKSKELNQTWTKENLEPYQEKLLEWTGHGFDLRVHIVDPKTGQMIRRQPYSLMIDRDHGSIYLRDGRRYSEAGVWLDAPKENKVNHVVGTKVIS